MNRLSKLQKWILTTLLKRSDSKYNILLVREIFYSFYKTRNNSLEASVSRSLRNLYKKGLIIPLKGRTILSKNVLKPDYAMAMAIEYQKAGKSREDYEKDLQDLIKRYGKREKLLSVAMVEVGETIQALALTDLGKQIALMLSNNKTKKLNNKGNG